MSYKFRRIVTLTILIGMVLLVVISGLQKVIMKRAVPVIIAGIILWTIALVISILVNAMAKVILACLFAIFLGFLGIRYTKRRGN